MVHAHFIHLCFRSASVKKFMVGFELLGEANAILPPNKRRQRLREACSSRS